MKALIREFWQEEDGLQTVEMVLILIVLVGLVVSFQSFATTWLGNALDDLNTSVNLIKDNPVKVVGQ